MKNKKLNNGDLKNVAGGMNFDVLSGGFQGELHKLNIDNFEASGTVTTTTSQKTEKKVDASYNKKSWTALF